MPPLTQRVSASWPSVLHREALAGLFLIIIYKAGKSFLCFRKWSIKGVKLNSSTLYHSWQSAIRGVEKLSMHRKPGIVKETKRGPTVVLVPEGGSLCLWWCVCVDAAESGQGLSNSAEHQATAEHQTLSVILPTVSLLTPGRSSWRTSASCSCSCW